MAKAKARSPSSPAIEDAEPEQTGQVIQTNQTDPFHPSSSSSSYSSLAVAGNPSSSYFISNPSSSPITPSPPSIQSSAPSETLNSISNRNIANTQMSGGYSIVPPSAPQEMIPSPPDGMGYKNEESDDVNKGIVMMLVKKRQRENDEGMADSLREVEEIPKGKRRTNVESSSRATDVKHLSEVRKIIDTEPNTKDKGLSYEINWAVSDKHELHKKMRPWILRELMELLKDDAEEMVHTILSSIREHVCASKMLNIFQCILLDKGEMFFVNYWRRLIFEIQRAERESESAAKFAECFSNVIANKERSEVVGALTENKDGIRDGNCYRQFNDTIPKTKDELLSYEISWAMSDKHEMHKKMRPWACIEAMEYHEKLVTPYVDDLVSSINDHSHSSKMVKLAERLLDGHAEMFVSRVLRMLMLKIKKLETESAEHVSNARCNDSLKSCVPQGLRKMKWISDMVPKTNEELFSFEINWDVYDKYGLQWTKGGWVSREILAHVGLEKSSPVVGYIMSSLADHVSASEMQKRLQPIFGDESEMFVRKMWRNLIFATEAMLLP